MEEETIQIDEFLSLVVSSLDILEIKGPITRESIKKKFREKAIVMHPDAGGNKRDFLELVEAKAVLIALLKYLESTVEKNGQRPFGKYNKKRKLKFSSISLLQIRNLFEKLEK